MHEWSWQYFREIAALLQNPSLDHHQELFLGNQILERHLEDYDTSLRRFEQSQHTLENIWKSLERVFEDPEGTGVAKARFADFLVLDSVVGNTDRHNENWGIARRYDQGKWIGYLARSFDHASSLGRELSDERARATSEQWSILAPIPGARQGWSFLV